MGGSHGEDRAAGAGGHRWGQRVREGAQERLAADAGAAVHLPCVRQITRATTTRPKLAASKELYALGKRLIRICDLGQAEAWVSEYQAWCVRWEAFLAEKTPTPGGGWEYTHARLVKARNGLNRLASRGVLFTFVDPTWGRAMPAMNNRIEGATNAPLRQVLRDHRGMRLSRRIKAVFWWCYMHTEHPLASGSDPQNHANRRPDRRRLAPGLTRARRQRCHPPMGRRHRLPTLLISVNNLHHSLLKISKKLSGPPFVL
ncbi:hypothetical protein HD592_001589 [Schaalia hyovaginalis]|uniref:Transposase n=1 Tax=Schaalia hyovaginalis TaxID=29316 RepID=A0A923E7P4_9ACTO|nr:hypothetical protein [Schaalia hyovaginalis]